MHLSKRVIQSMLAFKDARILDGAIQRFDYAISKAEGRIRVTA